MSDFSPSSTTVRTRFCSVVDGSSVIVGGSVVAFVTATIGFVPGGGSYVVEFSFVPTPLFLFFRGGIVFGGIRVRVKEGEEKILSKKREN